MRHGSPSPAHLVEMSPTVIYSARASGDFGATYVSPNVTRQMGYVPEDFTEDSGFWAKGLHPDDRERVLAGMSALRNLSTTMGHSTGLIREQCPVW